MNFYKNGEPNIFQSLYRFYFHHLNLYRFIKAGNKETLPVGVFVKRRQMVLLTLKQLMELKKVCIKDTDTRVILHMKGYISEQASHK